MIFTSLSPNTEPDDVLLAVKTLFSPWKWNNDQIVESFEATFAQTVGVKYVTTVDSGRTSLYTILKAFGIGAGDEVIVQAYTCVAVPDPVLWVGAKPVYVDCTSDLTIDTNDLRSKITSATKAIVVQHTFGQPAAIEEIIKIAAEKNIKVIEDCAHSLGATHNGKQLGRFGDASFFSFGRDKCISSVFGGAIATNSADLNAKIREITGQFPLPSSVWIIQQLFHPLILSISKATYNFLSLGKVILELSRRLHIISRAVEPLERQGGKPAFTSHQFSPALAVLAAHQLEKLPRYNAHRKECARLYSIQLAHNTVLMAPAFVEGHSYLRYTVTVSNTVSNPTPNQVSTPKAFFLKARKYNIQLGDWYTTVIAPTNVNYEKIAYVTGSCPNAEKYAATTFNLPTHISITPKMIEYISRHVFN